MTKQCPNCGSEIDNKKETCPKCGHSFNEDQLNEESLPKENLENDQNKENTSSFLNKDQNENIEWSELKDMSIGHVMTMFNEQKTDEESETNEQEQAEELTTASKATKEDPKEAGQVSNAATLSQYINEHKNETQDNIEKTAIEAETELPEETNPKTESDAEIPLSDEQSKPKDKGLDDVNPNEPENTPAKPTDTKSEQVKEDKPREEITKFTKPDDQTPETKPIGPKALPVNKTEIPSKSKKPEEIEMDEAPIFFKDVEEANAAKSQFVKPTENNKSKEEPSTPSANKNYKKMSIALAAVVVIVGGSWFAYSQTQKKSATGGEVTQKQEKLATQTEKELNSYFSDDKQLFLKPEMVSVSTKTIKEHLDTLKDDSNYKKLDALYNKVTDKQSVITKANELFAQPIIDGSKLNDVAIKADKKIDVTKREEKDDFDRLINQAIDQASNQYDQLQKAKLAVDVFYKNNELTETLTRENYTAAKTEVDKVKSESLRKPLSEVLVKASSTLNDLEAAAAVQPPVSVDQTPATTPSDTISDYQGNNTQTGSGVQPDSNTFSAPNAEGIYTDPVYSVNPSDVSDMSNPAWSWAPGVQEKVIATCIQRGYITAGGYSLQPARIINGEGYYNLYGSDNQYLVTINAKTGWFKGNASRNAGR
ncbi:cell division site-positioning protein MapZ family protein [Candidatus Enterococcus ikei]|uniref:Zinc ribbon domain-containing protein n=1 Tax=Candidatus Enterococcus ikei TaxID=2815326 RepID=A0ABS3H2E8_9ENTE|nr:cell division site-positioning protein MapZ family protein [Enterococcus sp. DIV0869a]MBO0441706.1 zinc ribbon domain-containing protein [Enterococcus sp. DIV0869a]